MSKEKRRVPKLRFPGFTEDWEQRKLGDYLIQYTEITTQNNQYPVLTSSRKGLFFQTDYYDGNQIASKDNTGYNIVPYGYFTYRHMSDDEIFHFNINYIVDKGIVSTLYPVFTTKNLNSDFLQLQLNYGHEFRKYAVLLKQGGSRTYMYFNKLKSLNLTISTSIGEQEIIAKFFILFEKLITLHQRKLDNLKLKKKALLQKLFPKNGERYPELRFPGFTDAWEQRKFGDLFEYERPDAYIVKSDNYNNDFNMPVLTANKAFILGYTNEENSYNKPSIIFDDFTLDRKYVDFPYMLKSSAIKILTSKNQHNLRFLFERLNSTRFEVLGHARHYISVVQNTTTLCPSVNEEICISNLLTKFDELITLHQRKFDHLQLQKKALLQQMFV